MRAGALIVLGALTAGAVWYFVRRDSSGADVAQVGGSLLAGVGDVVEKTQAALWSPPASAAPYLRAIAQAEDANGIPRNMLARLLYQESRFRPEIINGTVRSSAGAIGIAQFMPATAGELGIDPRDPAQAIPAAGRYLAQLYRRFGNWSEALAAYNWGQGNVARKGLGAAPAETRSYFSSILSDLGLS